MPFVSFSSQLILDNTTAVGNVFINEYLPAANGDCVRVYLYGLYKCAHAESYDNTLEHFATTLNLSEDDVLSAFMYWQDVGLVQVLSVKPIEVRYLSVKASLGKIKKYAKGRYDDFNVQMQTIIDGNVQNTTEAGKRRMITPTEFSEYYYFLESMHVEPAALLMIAKYCVDKKGANLGYHYILDVAKRWAYAGIKTVDAVEEKLQAERGQMAEVSKILKTLGVKKTAESADFDLFNKWTQHMGYHIDVILNVAKTTKGSMHRLDLALSKYFELKLFEKAEIENYLKDKSDLISLAIAINRKIGEYIPNVEAVVETYITDWQLKGFDAETLLSVAGFCFKSGIRKLEGMNSVVNKFYKLGIMTTAAIDSFVSDKISQDKTIKDILIKLNITHEPNQIDRDFYHTWKHIWGFSDEIIEYVVTLSSDKARPMQYMNKILSSYFEQKINTIEVAKNTPRTTDPATEKQFKRHSYSDSDFNRLFSNINFDEVEF